MKRRPTKEDKHRQGLYIFAAVIVAFISLIGLYFYLAAQRVATDPETLCPEEGALAHTVVLVDKTDAFSVSQRRLLGEVIRRVGADLNQFEKLSIFILDHINYRLPTPVFALCNPGDGSEASKLYQNPRKIRAKFEESFGEPLDRTIDTLATAAESPRSPIMEMLREVSTRDDFARGRGDRTLILFSDMLQHMPGDYSQFTDHVSFDRFELTDYAQTVKTDLKGAEVQIVYLIHEPYQKRQTRGHVRFWERYFDWIDGRLKEVRPIR